MRREFEVIALDKANKPVVIVTITENSKLKAMGRGRKFAELIGYRFHQVKPLKS